MTSGSVLGDPTGVFVVLRHEDARWMGRLLAPRAGGPPRVAFPADQAPTHLPMGTVLTAGLAARTMDRPAQCRARLLGVEWRDDLVGVELELDDPTIWTQVMPNAYRRAGDRREWPRLAPTDASDVLVPVHIDAGPKSGRRLAAWLVDASRGGVGLRFAKQAEVRLCQAHQFTVWLTAPHGLEVRTCRVRHRKLLPVGVRYGLAFEGPPVSVAEPVYEPIWTCGGCATGPLLAESHACCPNCGRPKGLQRSMFPDWDELISADEHRFTGVDRTCLRCGSSWSADARNCGHCGTRLPQTL